MNTEQKTTEHGNLRDAYYQWLAKIYSHLLDDDARSTDAIIDETPHELAPHEYHPDLVDNLRIDIAAARTTLRQDREEFTREWRKIEQDLAVKLLSIADKTDVELAAMREETADRHHK
ncbi:hypothetical protein A9404_03490 [Halothiobacillus diazotrophicus]|uniref:Uncharacterized protein n=1 Tax=Halothiobacillus diazotrophicus TaxID=1860122 RepID=A0A191ZFB1_9GAMM|nr:hypothetical protein [Halothiobacillus diazotrophicus]ANJ66566.1 hypothetical protein A9404_03490 [Halothiobacillus diazotrophicus]